jgi:hypothetical protein
LLVEGHIVPADRLILQPDPPLMLWAEPSDWLLPRGFRFEEQDDRTLLHLESPEPVWQEDTWVRMPDGAQRLTLRWSREALAASAYAMTFWYMECIGEAVFANPRANPWPEMSAAEAGRNAATQSFYYAILRARTKHEDDRAVALYNTYGFGYALGMNFRGPDGRRRMLWPEDLRELLRNGITREGCRIAE